jgi:hypothetical protein
MMPGGGDNPGYPGPPGVSRPPGVLFEVALEGAAGSAGRTESTSAVQVTDRGDLLVAWHADRRPVKETSWQFFLPGPT